MMLLRDLWATSPRRVALLVVLIVLGAGGQAVAAPFAGQLLTSRSTRVLVALAVALTIKVVADLVVGLAVAGLTADWAARVRRRLCAVAFGQDLQTLEATPVGELLDRIDQDVYQVASELRGSGVRIIQSMTLSVAAVVTAFVVWWPAGVGMLAALGLMALSLRGRVGRISQARMAEEEAWSALAAVMEESIHGQDDVRTTLGRPYVLRLFAERSSAVLRFGRRVWAMSANVTVIAAGLTRASIGVVVVGGAWGLATGRVDAAQLTAVWLLAVSFGLTVEHISRMIPELQYALGAWGRVVLLAASPQEPVGGRAISAGDLQVRGLTFRYDGEGPARRPPALRDVDLTFRRGRSYALIGRTGSGKSTLAKAVIRAVEPPRGTVFLDGVDLLDLDLEALRRWVAVVPQRTEILAGTLAENVALFEPELLPHAAEAMAELGLEPWVRDLPDGIETRLGDGGYVLSAGQEQLVAFARILVRDPHVVILDEATARLDPVTEARVHAATQRLLTGRIGILIAHRLSSVRQCDEVVVLADGRVVEAGPLSTSQRFADLLSAGRTGSAATALGAPSGALPGGSGLAVADAPVTTEAWDDALVDDGVPQVAAALLAPAQPERVEAPPLPPAPPARTLREVGRLALNDKRFGLGALALFLPYMLFALDGSVLPWLWSRLIAGEPGSRSDVLWPAAGLVAVLLVTVPVNYFTGRWFPEWWVRQMLRISLRLVHGQTGPRRVSAHTPAEVVAQGGDTERVVILADNMIDQVAIMVIVLGMTVISGSPVPALFFLATVVISALAASAFGPRLAKRAATTVATRAAFATALVSSLSAARTVKLSGAVRGVLDHLARLDRVRSDRQRREIVVQVWARSTPSMVAGLAPIGIWALYVRGSIDATAALVAVATVGSAHWFAWTTASLISALPSARVWTRRTVAMSGEAAYSSSVPGVDISAGTAPAPVPAQRQRLSRLELRGFTAVHEDGTVGARDVDLTVERGELVLVVGPVGSGKSSLLRALAGIVHHTGDLLWNGREVADPTEFLRPNQVAYVAQLPRVLSGTIAENITLGHSVDPGHAVHTAQLEHDLSGAGGGLGLMIGHKGTRLSGGQLQRVALARALAPRTELLIADDVSSAIDVTTELDLWRALRERGITVIGATSKRAALEQADKVLVLAGGTVLDQGLWADLQQQWGHLAG
ncbi:MAG: ABC transporter ATP-binding protein [Kineosporiaceae bacterium]|nr:ABC transporter ATP-binding protein [Kineosporiaceae bacterium]MBK8078021.1 ABC transporter ATP-binding protein [Kineosporiaceae bacterium]